ncbi:MAG: UBP-type zinc finger domain-containing protein [Frankiaceae bacterium]
MTPGPYDMTVSMKNVRPNGSAPRCEHVDSLAPVTPASATCRDCEACDAGWLRLVICLTCGWVACSDDSTHRHALAHYEETDHPLVGELAPGSDRRWCYIHRRAV